MRKILYLFFSLIFSCINAVALDNNIEINVHNKSKDVINISSFGFKGRTWDYTKILMEQVLFNGLFQDVQAGQAAGFNIKMATDFYGVIHPNHIAVNIGLASKENDTNIGFCEINIPISVIRLNNRAELFESLNVNSYPTTTLKAKRKGCMAFLPKKILSDNNFANENKLDIYIFDY